MHARHLFAWITVIGSLAVAAACSPEPLEDNPRTSSSGGSSATGGTGGSATGGTGGATGGVGGTGGAAGSMTGGTGGSSMCPTGQTLCSGMCVNPQSDPMNCGNCGVACGAGLQCVNSACSCAALGATYQNCNGACIDTSMDEANCGACGTVCGAGQQCTAGVCACTAPLVACGTPPTCVDPSSNAMFCSATPGTCGTACTTPFCSAGMCSATCAFTDCSGSCINTMGTDPQNCGACGMACAVGQQCSAGVCGCGAGQTLCNGTCVDTMTDPANCGTCGTTCNGQACSGGSCGCAAGQTMCDGLCKDLMTDNANCGMCGTSCTAPAMCSAGSCGSTAGRPAGCAAAADLIADFEETGTNAVVSAVDGRDGWWYVFSDSMSGTQTPAKVQGAPIMKAGLAPGDTMATCQTSTLHSTAGSHPQYVGFGATFKPTGPSDSQKAAVSLAAYTGISFRIRANSGNAPPIWFEMLTRENQPGANCTNNGSPCGDLAGTATNAGVDAYNTHGRLLSNISATWQTVTIPFANLGARYLPAGDAAGCSSGTTRCEAPPFVPASALGLQVSLYDQFSTAGAYDLWVDDFKLTTGDAGIPTYTQTAGATKPFPQDAAFGTCTKPTGASGKHLIQAYLNWKSTFVVADGSNQRVRRPEDSNDSVSEGIAYGMLIAVAFNDKPLFDGLWGYWKSHCAVGSGAGCLMTWRIGGQGGSGSALDADEDAAFALIQAGKQWGGSYASDAGSLIGTIWANEIESGTLVPKPGNSFGGNSVTNPSYFAPAFYRAFAAVNSGNNWNGVATKAYQLLNAIEGSNGLVPAWCTNGCTAAGSGGLNYTDETRYQYDSHRTPWRMAMDACWNSNADARDYITKTTAFFKNQSNNGFGRIIDIYSTTGTLITGAKYNSMSIIGTAAAGAMYGSNQDFLDRAWQFLIAAQYTADPTFRSGDTAAYTYYNATVGLLTALTLSGNFPNW